MVEDWGHVLVHGPLNLESRNLKACDVVRDGRVKGWYPPESFFDRFPAFSRFVRILYTRIEASVYVCFLHNCVPVLVGVCRSV